MGGGDLNLKKSWHPNTLKNQKRVYEAEQADAAERRKLHELQREIEHERNFEELRKIGQNSGVLATDDSRRLEWMYKGAENTLNREDYLTGRSIDKHFEEQDKVERQKDTSNLVGVTVQKNHVEHECIPFSIRAFRSAPANEEQVDLQRKIMEDPLMMIQQREMERRQKLLQNPVKLKEIHRLLQEDEKVKQKSSGKKKQKSKKSKKKRSHSDSNGSDEDLDSQLAKRYKQLLGDKDDKLESMNIDKILNEKYEKLSSELDKINKSKKNDKKKKSKKKKRSSSSSSSSSSSTSQMGKNNARDNRRRDEFKNSSQKSGHRDVNESSYYRRNFNRRSRSPKRSVEDREFKSRYNNNARDRYADSRRSPARDRSRSPRNKNRIRQTGRKSYTPIRKSPSRDRYKNHRRNDRDDSADRSNRYTDRSRDRRRSKSPARNQDRRSKSPARNQGRRSKSPARNQGRRSKTPARNQGRRSKSPARNQGRRSKSPARNQDRRSKSPMRNQDRRSKSPMRNQSRRSKSPAKKQVRRSRSRSESRSQRTRDLKPIEEPRKRSKSPEKPKSSVNIMSAVRTAALLPKDSSKVDTSSSSGSSSDSNSDSDHSDRAAPKNYGLITATGDKIELKNDTKFIPVMPQKKPTTKYVPPQPRKKMTEEEKEARLQEMRNNVEWHDKEQTSTKKRNEARAQRETEEEQIREFDRNYIHKEMHKALNNQDSVEARLKSNKNNIQRMSSSMHSHFAKK